MARRAPTTDTSVADEHADVIKFYRRELAAPAVFPWQGCEWEPVRIGPSWQVDADGRWLLPDATIGWDVLAWCGTELQHGRDQPWRFTLEQARFLLWWFAVDERGRWLFTDGVLQRIKGWGKDPIGACLLYVEALGPCRVAGMDGDTPIAADRPDAWVQAAATSLEQTKNTMRLMPGLLTPAAKEHYRVQVGKELVHALGDERLIQAVTSSPATLEGARSTFVLRNETQHWLKSNDGHEMADVIERNLIKSDDGAARSLAITNAPEPGLDSAGERDREAYEAAAAGETMTAGILYDSLEAPPDAPLVIDRLDDEPKERYVERVKAVVGDVIAGVRGDSLWLDVPRIVSSILDTRNAPSRSRRFWYNQLHAAEDAWLSPLEWDSLADPARIVADGELVTLGFDGSKSDDHTALIGCRVDDGHLFTLGVWNPEKFNGEAPRGEIDRAVRAAFERFDVVGFYSDLHPWESYVDAWALELGDKLCARASTSHAVAWDMRTRTQSFTFHAERFLDAVVEGARDRADGAELDDVDLTHDGDARLRRHAHNTRRRTNRWGVSFGKENRESSRKVDAVAAAVLARIARHDYLALPVKKQRRQRSGRAAFY